MREHLICLSLVVALLFSGVCQAGELAGKGAMEYFTANPNGRVLVKVQVWGDVAIPGVHFVPDDTTLLALIGAAGGPRGSLADARIKLHREAVKDGKKNIDILEFTGEQVLGTASIGALVVQAGDIVYVEASPESERSMRTLTLISTVTGLISSLLLTYVLIRQQK